MGKPIQGQSSSELHGGKAGSGRGGGLAGVGASGAASGNQMVDEETQAGQRGLEKEGAILAGKKGNTEVGAD